MSCIVKQKVGKHVYLYESVSFRNSDGKPRNKRTPVGKLDPVTGNPVYKPEYLERMAENGTPVAATPAEPLFSPDDVRRSSIRSYGAFYLLDAVASRIGLTGALREGIPSRWRELFMLACYLLLSGDPFLYCENWLEETESLPVGDMSSQRISELLLSLTSLEREGFYEAWCASRSEEEYLALDITSISSYSKLIEDVEWGYNRDREHLPQVNLCMLTGERSRLPVYQVAYSGSLKDVSTLRATLASVDAVRGDKPLLLVMDKGFYSARKIDALLEDEKKRFIVSVPFTASFAKEIVAEERSGIDRLEHTIVSGSDSIRGVTRTRPWKGKHLLFVHVYCNALGAMKVREELYAHVTELFERALSDPAGALSEKESAKYLAIVRSEETDGTEGAWNVSVRSDVVEKELRHAGWMVLIGNRVSDAKEALAIYRDKDVVEKGFLRLKRALALSRLRVHSDGSMRNKMFVGFLALILMCRIHSVMADQGLYRRMTMKKLLMTLSKLRVQEINGVRILFPLTKEQKTIYKAFGVEEPT